MDDARLSSIVSVVAVQDQQVTSSIMLGGIDSIP